VQLTHKTTSFITPGSSVSAQLSVDQREITELVLEVVEVAENNGLKLPREFGLLLKQVKLRAIFCFSLFLRVYVKVSSGFCMSWLCMSLSLSVINCMTQDREHETVYFDSNFHFFLIYSCHSKSGFILRPVPEDIGTDFGSLEGRKSSRQL
jgi:hypothetical protein